MRLIYADAFKKQIATAAIQNGTTAAAQKASAMINLVDAQPAITEEYESVYFNAVEMLVEKLEERSPVIDYSWCLREYKENVKWLKSQNN